VSAPAHLGRLWTRACDETHDWSATTDRVLDLPWYGIDIEEGEGDFPSLELKIEADGRTVDEIVSGLPRILISVDRLYADGSLVDTILLFDGLLDDTGEIEFGDADLTLRYQAIRADWEALQAAVLAGLSLPIVDPCAGDAGEAHEALDGIPSLVTWSRTTRRPTLSSIVAGGNLFDVGSGFDRESLRIKRKPLPLERVDVVLSGEWTEALIGEYDVGAMIEVAAGGELTSLNPAELLEKWPKPGADLGGGYVVSVSSLEDAGVPQGASNEVVVQQAASAGRTFRPGATQPQSIRLRKWWLKPRLLATASSSVKRAEQVLISVYNGGQGAKSGVERVPLNLDRLAFDAAVADWQPNTHYGKGAIVRFAAYLWRSNEPHDSTSSLWLDRWYRADDGDWSARWEPMPSDGSPLGGPGAATYFQTPRGLLSIDHAILVAIQKLAYSQRSWEATFTVDAFDVLDISCRDMVRIVSDEIPCVGGEVVGKVKSYRFAFSAEDAVCEITIAISTGSGVSGGLGARVVSPYAGSVYRVAYTPPAFPVPFAPRMGVSDVRVTNEAEEQARLIQEAAAAGSEVSHALDDAPTSVRVATLPAGGGETSLGIILQGVTAYQGYRGIRLRA